MIEDVDGRENVSSNDKEVSQEFYFGLFTRIVFALRKWLDQPM